MEAPGHSCPMAGPLVAEPRVRRPLGRVGVAKEGLGAPLGSSPRELEDRAARQSVARGAPGVLQARGGLQEGLGARLGPSPREPEDSGGTGSPPTSCVIGGISYAADAVNAANSCQVCKPATSASGWSNADEGTSCGGSQYCNAGTCKAGCFIAGAYYSNGVANPANACQTCQTSFALTSWTTSAAGAGCGPGEVCSGGTCQSGCWIAGALVASGTINAANACQICRPTASTGAWSNVGDGTSCGSGQICGTGTCQAACYVARPCILRHAQSNQQLSELPALDFSLGLVRRQVELCDGGRASFFCLRRGRRSRQVLGSQRQWTWARSFSRDG